MTKDAWIAAWDKFLADTMQENHDEPDVIIVGMHWSDEQLRSIIKSGAMIMCDRQTWERCQRLSATCGTLRS